jgi:hypothetical protein
MKIFPLRTNLVIIMKIFPLKTNLEVAMKRKNPISSVSNHSTKQPLLSSGN